MRLYYPRHVGCGHDGDVAYASPGDAKTTYVHPSTDEDVAEVFILCQECQAGTSVAVKRLDFRGVDDGEYNLHNRGSTMRVHVSNGSALDGSIGARGRHLLSEEYRGATLQPDNPSPHQGPIREYEVYRMLGPGPEHDYVFRPVL